jgi:hypothetical protein
MAVEGGRWVRTDNEGTRHTYTVAEVNGEGRGQCVRLDNEATGRPAWQYIDTLSKPPWEKIG